MYKLDNDIINKILVLSKELKCKTLIIFSKSATLQLKSGLCLNCDIFEYKLQFRVIKNATEIAKLFTNNINEVIELVKELENA